MTTPEERYKQIEEDKSQMKELNAGLELKILNYRIESIKRILDYMRSKQVTKTKSKYDFDNLLVHCLNKLNGNIDGIELDLTEKEILKNNMPEEYYGLDDEKDN